MYSILAQIDRAQRLDGLHRGFVTQTDQSDVWIKMVGLAVIVLLVLACLAMLNRVQQGRVRPTTGNSSGLFRQVLKELSIGLNDRSLLNQVAAQMKLAHPTVMLLTPQIYSRIIYDYMAAAPGRRGKAEMARFAAICRQVFNQDLSPPTQQLRTSDPSQPTNAGRPERRHAAKGRG
jgi:hypothetical protein